MPLRYLSNSIRGKIPLADALTKAAAIFEAYTWGTANYTDASITPAKLSFTVQFTEVFTSAEQTITAAGALTLAHSLSSAPSLIQCRLICKTAELGYSIGDEVIVNPASNDLGGVNNRGLSVVPDGTNVNIRFGSATNSFALIRKDTGAAAAIVNGNWKLIVKAWA